MADRHRRRHRWPFGRPLALEHHPVKTPAPNIQKRRNPINTAAFGRRELLAITAAFVMLLIVFQATQRPEEASAQSSSNSRDDIGTLVSSGNDVKGSSKNSGRPKSSSGAASMPQTGTGVDTPALFGLVLLLDGALALLLASRKPMRVYSPN